MCHGKSQWAGASWTTIDGVLMEDYDAVEAVITHTPPWTSQGMGYDSVVTT